MGVLHTGAHYPDEISDNDVIYHYPTTGRGPGVMSQRSPRPRQQQP